MVPVLSFAHLLEVCCQSCYFMIHLQCERQKHKNKTQGLKKKKHKHNVGSMHKKKKKTQINLTLSVFLSYYSKNLICWLKNKQTNKTHWQQCKPTGNQFCGESQKYLPLLANSYLENIHQDWQQTCGNYTKIPHSC